MLTIRIFVSSPGDVGEERVITERVIERLRGEFGRSVQLEPFLWEHEPLRATQHFQEQITPPADCDIVVCILWSRLGTRLPANFNRDDGTRFASGTEWEFETAAHAYKTKGTPDLLTYRKVKEPAATLADRAKLEEQLKQYEALQQFIQRWFEQDGEFKAAFKTFDNVDAFERMLEGDLRKLIRQRLDVASGAAPAVPEVRWHAGSPFRGLDSFDYEHRSVFFGRTRAIGAIKEALTAQAARGMAFLIVFGASGMGKSSLVRAGVIPTITQPGVIEGIGMWRWCVFRASDASGDIFDGLAAALLGPTACPELRSMALDTAELGALFREAPQRVAAPLKTALAQAAADLAQREHVTSPPQARLAIAIDQMEEIFTLDRVDADARARFIVLLSTLASSGVVMVLAAMRSDFYARCAELPELVAMKGGSGQYDLQPPSFDEIGQMINSPASAAGLHFEHDPHSDERLDAAIHEAANRAPHSLPLLEFVLDELYRRRTESGGLTFSAYRELGGLEGALASRAEEVFSHLTPEVQEVVPRIFHALVTIQAGTEEIAVGRRVAWVKVADSPLHEVALNSFADARLLVKDRADNGEATIALAHEALLHHWRRLEKWIDDDKEMLRTRARISELATLWRGEAKRPDMLLRSDRLLSAAEELVEKRGTDLDEFIVEFVQASAESRERRRRLRRLAVAGLSVIAIITSVLAVLAYRSSREARRAGQLSLARQLAADAELIERDSPQLLQRSTLLAIESARRVPLVENDTFLRLAGALIPKTLYTFKFAGGVQSVAFSRDGRLFATGSFDRSARVFSSVDGKELLRKDEQGRVGSVAFSPDGRLLATASDDGTARVFEIATGKEVSRLTHDNVVRVVSFSPDGRWVATASYDNTARVFDAMTGKELSRITHGNRVRDVAFAPDGSYVATGSSDGTARVFEAATGREASRVSVGLAVNAVTFSRDGRYVAIGSYDNSAWVFEAVSGKRVSRLATGGAVWKVAFSQDGRKLAVASYDNTARVFDIATRVELSRFAHTGQVETVAFSPDDHYVATGSWDNTARVFDVTTGSEISRLTYGGEVSAVVFSPDGRFVLTGSRDATARMFETAPASNQVKLSTRDRRPDAITFSADARYVAAMSKRDGVRVFDAGSGAQVFHLPTNDARAIALAPDGRLLAVASGGKLTWIVEVGNGKEVSRVSDNAAVNSTAFSPDQSRVAIGGDDGRATVFEVATGRQISELKHNDAVRMVAFSSDGSYLATGSLDLSARLFAAANGRELSLFLHDGAVNSIAISADGYYVATAGNDHLARVFEAFSGKELARFPHPDVVQSVAFSPDGTQVATVEAVSWDRYPPVGDSSLEKTARVFDLKKSREVTRLTQLGDLMSLRYSPDGKYLLAASMSPDSSQIVLTRYPARLEDLIDAACRRLSRNLTPKEWGQFLSDEPYRKTCRNLPVPGSVSSVSEE